VLEGIRHTRRLGGLLRAHFQSALLRAGLRSGLFAALRQPARAPELAEREQLAPDLTAAFLQAAHAHGLLQRRGERFRLSRFVRWLLDAPEAEAALALLEQASLSYEPVLARLPELLHGAERPLWGGPQAMLRAALASRLGERRAVAALVRVPGVRSARHILDVGCGTGGYLVDLLGRYRDALGVGVELDASLAERARANLRAAGVHRRAEILVGDYTEVDPGRSGFDLVLLNQDLHYFGGAERRRLFERILGQLAPGGVLAIQTPVVQEDALSRAMGLAATLASFDLFLRAHRNLYGLPEPEALRAALTEIGFQEVGEVPIVPGGALRYVWARAPGSRAEHAAAQPRR